MLYDDVGDHCVVVPSDVVSVSKLYVDEVYEISCLFIVPDFINLTLLLGIEEYLQGPLLSYINTLGYVSLGFESGQHDNKQAILNNIAFINLALEYSNVIKRINTNKPINSE